MRVAPSPISPSSMKAKLAQGNCARSGAGCPPRSTRCARISPPPPSPDCPPSDREPASRSICPSIERRTPRRCSIAARRRRVRLYVPVVESRRHRRLRFYPLVRQDAPRRVRHLGPARRRAPPRRRRRAGSISSSCRWSASTARPPPRHGRRVLRSGARLPARTGVTGADRAWSVSPSIVSAPIGIRGAARHAPRCARDRARRAAFPARPTMNSHSAARPSMNHWLLKSEPGTFSIDDLAAQPRQHHRMGRRAQLPGPQHACGTR